LCRGIDHRPIISHRIRKSISVERTFSTNLESLEACAEKVESLFQELEEDLFRIKVDRKIAKLFIKLKFSDFSKTTVERVGLAIHESSAQALLREAFGRKALPVRLIGIGVRLATHQASKSSQLEFEFQN
jgi:DNA polymerase-4